MQPPRHNHQVGGDVCFDFWSVSEDSYAHRGSHPKVRSARDPAREAAWPRAILGRSSACDRSNRRADASVSSRASRIDARPLDEHCLMRAIQADRAISTGKLHALPHFHTRPINVVVFHGSRGRTRFEVGFPLRCLQRLSRPHIATLLCRWRDNRSTRGASIPVLSY